MYQYDKQFKSIHMTNNRPMKVCVKYITVLSLKCLSS